MLPPSIIAGFPGGSEVRLCLAKQEMQETRVQSLDQEDALGKDMETHSSILAWGISRTEERGRVTAHRASKSQTQPSTQTHTQSVTTSNVITIILLFDISQ